MPVDFRIKPPRRNNQSDPPVTLKPEFGAYDPLYGHEALMNLTLEDLLKEMDEWGIRDSIMQSEHDEHSWGGDEDWNNRVAEITTAHPDHFVAGFAGVDPTPWDGCCP